LDGRAFGLSKRSAAIATDSLIQGLDGDQPRRCRATVQIVDGILAFPGSAGATMLDVARELRAHDAGLRAADQRGVSGVDASERLSVRPD